jgi:hypothetical protein
MATPKTTHRQRFERLFGPERLGDKIAMIFNVNPATVYRWLADDDWPGPAIFALDVLEACPRPKWPAIARQALELRDARRSG